MKKIFTLFLLSAGFVSSAQTASRTTAAFTIGNVVIYRIGDGVASLANTGGAVFLDEYTPAGVLVQSIALPTTASGANAALIASGTATSEGLLTRSSNGQFLIATGYNSSIPASASLSGTTAATVSRTIARINNAGTVNTTTSLTDYASGNNPRSATSIDGTSFWAAGGAGGVVYATFGSTAITNAVSTTVTNIRHLGIFNGQLYFSTASGAFRIASVGTGVPTTTAQAATSIPGFSTSTGSPYAFFFADLDATVPGLDVLYVADDAAGIQKYSLVAGNWTLNGTIGTGADAYRGITGVAVGTTVSLYATRKGGSGAAGGGELASIVDATGYNLAPVAVPVLLATAASNTAFRGIALAPTINPVPLSLVSFNAGIDGKGTKIWWSTTNEINTKEFIIERSSDANQFTAVGTVFSKTSPGLNSYTFNDTKALTGNSYYRLKMIDRDGSFKYSGIVKVLVKEGSISLFPNPAVSSITVSYIATNEETTIKIFSVDGKMLQQQIVPKLSASSSINVAGLTKGKYLVTVERNSAKYITSFVK